MRLRVAADGTAMLEEPDDFTRFAVRAAPGVALDGIGRVEGSHAWVPPATLRRLAPRAGTPEWDQGFGRMLAYAEGKGWVDAEGAVRAHVEVI
jgi:hypothetical protein